jgi:hypothetical protein
LREKENTYLGSSVFDPEDLSLRAIWDFSKEEIFPELISVYGAQGARF